ncbi:MAG: FAD-binding oxidoreductase [Nitrososphaerales archaeon]
MPTKEVARSLIDILGKDKVVYDAEEIKLYGKDALHTTRALPKKFKPKTPIVVKPVTEDDVVTIVKYANRKGVPIVPYGAGTGLMGGAATVRRGIVVDMKNMSKIAVNQDDSVAGVGSGVLIKDLMSEAEKYGLLFAHDPWSANYSTVGGAIATNGVGYLACKYGSMGDQVLGLRVVAGDGRVIDMKPAKKRSTGLDLKNLFIGSEGVLGIILSATLRLYPIPAKQEILAYEFKDLATGYKCIKHLFSLGIRPASMDLFEVFDVKADKATREWLQDEEGTRLYLLFDGFKEEVDLLCSKAKNILKEFDGIELDHQIGEQYWKNRHDIADRYISFIRSSYSNTNIKFDFTQTSIPAGKLLEFDKICMNIASKYKVAVQGHGIWQAPEFYSMNLFADSSDANDRMCRAIDEMLKHAMKMGSIEYVHGVGIRLAHLMKEAYANEMPFIKKIKQIFDPNNIMNPGKVAL